MAAAPLRRNCSIEFQCHHASESLSEVVEDLSMVNQFLIASVSNAASTVRLGHQRIRIHLRGTMRDNERFCCLSGCHSSVSERVRFLQSGHLGITGSSGVACVHGLDVCANLRGLRPSIGHLRRTTKCLFVYAFMLLELVRNPRRRDLGPLCPPVLR